MDSLTQIALGSAVGIAVLGRKTSVARAAGWGAVVGTLPDLDALIPYADAISRMTQHRAQTHALLYMTLVAPALAWAIASWHRERPLFRQWLLAVWLILMTHTLLDWMTLYGTRLLLPFSDTPLGVGSVFVIDPLYTLPLSVGVVVALVRARRQKYSTFRAGTSSTADVTHQAAIGLNAAEKDGAEGRAQAHTLRGLRWNMAGLMISSAYLLWGVAVQAHVSALAQTSLSAEGIGPQRLIVTPAPLNSVLWRLLAVTPEHYFEAHHSLLDRGQTLQWRKYPRCANLIASYADHPKVAEIASFSGGAYGLSQQGDRLFVTDLRLGQEPYYFFRFDLGAIAGAKQPTGTAEVAGQVRRQGWDQLSVQDGARVDLAQGLPWLLNRLAGVDQPFAPALRPDPTRCGPSAQGG